MDGNYSPYDWTASSARIKAILDQPAGAYEEVEGLPDRDKLTFSNGFYGMCSAIFIDIRDSSGLTSKHNRPVLAKIYRSFISEMVAVLNSDPNVREVNIVGDCVWASYKTTRVNHINDVFVIAAQANTLLKLLNHHYEKAEITQLSIGIGVEYGRVLMIKAGYSGSTISDVVYMGDVVNRAAHLAHLAGRDWGSSPVVVGDDFYANLNEHNQGLLRAQWTSGIETVYQGDPIIPQMDDWISSLR
ncbi:adenylate/guanylate cyclase domain-containing protein [Corynebacterium falsenii]|uniref:Adenylate/guanylate cyclase domain-containing protein n=1 Tax=Corynebacterium falsenii TaxID=108486 RepID=A0A418Q5B1_9CORY|nr:adenylate/guanylate cyclase domain-containing protein [Corynebacterium falsenii]MDC7104617.1 adenylate/guanylate cyclase domain-containing protein [Corynebacterium falsenii]RIX33739.1 adenylate/guanylate cyclase domain-containing protein [Corynebacterium falsenii]